MPTYLKRGKDPEAVARGDAAVRATVETILADIEKRGDAAVRELSERSTNGRRRRFRLSEREIEETMSKVSEQDLDDIQFAQAQVRNFAEQQRACLQDLEVETLPGVVLGHKNIPVESGRLLRAGRQISDGRLGAHERGDGEGRRRAAHHRLRAAVSGQARTRRSSPPCIWQAPTRSIVLGGVQAVGAMALGTETIAPVDMLVGPGNAFVAEAKRQLYGRVGIDLFAGPTETLVIADDTRRRRNLRDRPARPGRAWSDHRPPFCSPTRKSSPRDTMAEIERLLEMLPTAEIAREVLGGLRRGHRMRQLRRDGCARPTGSRRSTCR